MTFRLWDSLPTHVITRWWLDLCRSPVGATEGATQTVSERTDLQARIARYEDAGHGACFLRHPGVAAIVQGALLHFDWRRYRLLEWCVMPNHVHLLVKPDLGVTLLRDAVSRQDPHPQSLPRCGGRGKHPNPTPAGKDARGP